jgi:hypothetical protein
MKKGVLDAVTWGGVLSLEWMELQSADAVWLLDHRCERPLSLRQPPRRERGFFRTGSAAGSRCHTEVSTPCSCEDIQISFYISMTHIVSFSRLIGTLQRDQKGNTRF